MSAQDQFRENKSVIVFIIFLIGCLLVFFMVPRITLPLGLAYVFYLMLRPFKSMLVKIGLPSTLAILIVLAGTTSAIVLPVIRGVALIEEEVVNFDYNIPNLEKYAKEKYIVTRQFIKEKIRIDIGNDHFQNGMNFVVEHSKKIIASIPQLFASFLEWTFLTPFFLFFFLKDDRGVRKISLNLCPNFLFERYYHLTYQFNKKIGNYVFAKFIEASIIGIIIGIGLILMGVKFPIVLAIVAGVTNIIPYLGPILGAIPAIAVTAFQFGDFQQVLPVCILFFIANTVDMVFVFPLLVSKIVDLHPISVVLSVILGSQLFGVFGMIISIPMAVAIKLIFAEFFSNGQTDEI